MWRQIPVVPLVALVALPVAADTIHVPGDLATIQAAVDAAQPGDVIRISAGTYNEAVVIDTKMDITLKGGKKATVDGGGVNTPFTIQNSTGVTLDGIAIDDGVTGVSITGSTTVVVQRCMISNHSADGVRAESSTGVVVQKSLIITIGGHGVDFSNGGAGAASSSTVAKNVFVFVTQNMVNVDGTGNLVEKNKAANVGGIAVVANGTGATVQKNKIGGTTGATILIDGNANTVLKNKIILSGAAGVQVNGDDNLVEKNKIAESGAACIDIEGSDNQILSNKLTVAGGNGIELGDLVSPLGTATGNVLERNKSILSTAAGFMVSDGPNLFRYNRGAWSGTFDLHDNSQSGTNVYDSNKFKTEQID